MCPWPETSAPAHASAHPTLAGGGESLQLLDEPRAPPGGGRKADASAAPPQAKYKAREAALKAQSERKPGKLPESPKRAEEIWQQSVIGDYLARFKVAGSGKGVVRGFFFSLFFFFLLGGVCVCVVVVVAFLLSFSVFFFFLFFFLISSCFIINFIAKGLFCHRPCRPAPALGDPSHS